MPKLWLTFILTLFLAACYESEPDTSTANQHLTISQPSDPEADNNDPQETNNDESQFFYFSYDDSSSTAARDLALHALNNGNKPATNLGRPYEFLNAEQFSHFNAQATGPFEVSIGAYQSQPQELSFPSTEDQALPEEVLALGINISGPVLTKAERPNVVMTFLIDVSGSMTSPYANETRHDITSLLDVTKHGLNQLTDSLKPGDVINLVTFNASAEVVLEAWQFGQVGFQQALSELYADDSTNLNAGIQLAYQVANRTYDTSKSNRVVILTDAYANTGEINPTIISQNTVINGREGIHFAGVGIGSSFNDQFLNELTEHGKGVYSAMITPTDAERIFTTGFIRFIDSAVSDVKFKLEYPASLQHLVSAAEEVSENSEEVQSIDFAYNSEQFFFELFSPQNNFSEQQEITLEIQYLGDGNQQQSIRITQTIAELLQVGEVQIKTAAAVSTLAFLISEKVQCDQVLASGLYQQSLNDLLFTDYQGYINTFCSL